MASTVTKFGIAAMALATAISAAGPAAAGGHHGGHYAGGYAYHGGYYGHGGYYYGGRRGISGGSAALLGVGALGLGLALGSALDNSHPVYTQTYTYPAYPTYGDYGAYDEHTRLENERLRLENERLRLENERQRRGLDDHDAAYRGDDHVLLGGEGRIDYDRAFHACLSAAAVDAGRQGYVVAMPYTWNEAQPLGQTAVRFRASLDGGHGVEMVCEADGGGVRSLDVHRS